MEHQDSFFNDAWGMGGWANTDPYIPADDILPDGSSIHSHVLRDDSTHGQPSFASSFDSDFPSTSSYSFGSGSTTMPDSGQYEGLPGELASSSPIYGNYAQASGGSREQQLGYSPPLGAPSYRSNDALPQASELSRQNVYSAGPASFPRYVPALSSQLRPRNAPEQHRPSLNYTAISSGRLESVGQPSLAPEEADVTQWLSEPKVPEERHGLDVSFSNRQVVHHTTRAPGVRRATSASSTRSRRSKREIMSGMSPHKCEQCSAGFDDLNGLQHHRRNVHGPRRHSCPFVSCNKTFMYPRELDRHVDTHDPFAPKIHCCPVPGCDRSIRGFSRKDNLTRHMNTHPPLTTQHLQTEDDDLMPDFQTFEQLTGHMQTHL